jgi:sulfur carrier protein
MTVHVTVNGIARELPDGATVASVIESIASAPQGRGVAVAIGQHVVPRSAWETTRLTDGAQLEVVAAVQGG